jgi:GAF domain-containing protein
MEQRTATAAFLRVASESRANLEPVFQDILASAMRFCAADSGCFTLCDVGRFEVVSIRGVTPAYAESLRAPIQTGPAAALGRVAAEPKILHLPDLIAETAYRQREPDWVAAVELEGARTTLHVPMLKGDNLIGVVTLYRRERRPFTDEHIALAPIFAGQAVIASEKTHLHRRDRRSVRARDQGRRLSEPAHPHAGSGRRAEHPAHCPICLPWR